MHINFSKYIVFDVEVMHSDLKIYILKDNKKSIIDIRDINLFIETVEIITDIKNLEYTCIGDYCTGFDIPLLIMIKNLYIKYCNELSKDKLINLIIDFANDKTKKLIKYGCHDTFEEFENIKNKIIFEKKFIDVKFVLGSKLQNTSLKHFQGAILNSIFDFDFDQHEYNKEKLDEYGLNDIDTSHLRFKHQYTQNLIFKLLELSKKIGIYIVNFVPNQIILYLFKKLNINYKKQYNKKQYNILSDLNIAYPRDQTISIIICNILTKLNEISRNKIIFNYLNYSISIDQLVFSIYNTKFKNIKNMNNATKIDLSEFILLHIIKCLKEYDSEILKIFYWLLENEIYRCNFVYNKLLKSIYTIFNNSSDYKIIDSILLKTINYLLELISNLYNNNFEIIGLIDNFIYINSSDTNKIKDILNSFDKDLRYFFFNVDTYIYNHESVIDSQNLNTGLFDIETRLMEKSVYFPSIASTKKFINHIIGNEKYKILFEDYLFVVGPCILGLETINKRASILVYGDKTLISNKNCENNQKFKSRYQLFNENIKLDDIKIYYDEEYMKYFE